MIQNTKDTPQAPDPENPLHAGDAAHVHELPAAHPGMGGPAAGYE